MSKKIKENKKTEICKSTFEKHYDSLSPKPKKQFDEGLKNFAISELILAWLEGDEEAVCKLAEIANVSTAIVQDIRSIIGKDLSLKSFFKNLGGLGCKKLMVEFKGELIPLDIYSSIKR